VRLSNPLRNDFGAPWHWGNFKTKGGKGAHGGYATLKRLLDECGVEFDEELGLRVSKHIRD
jgi:hypothetical protein